MNGRVGTLVNWVPAKVMWEVCSDAGEVALVEPSKLVSLATPSPREWSEETVKMMCDLGFPQEMVEACLRAALGNADLALSYCAYGIPPPLVAVAPVDADAGPLAQLRAHSHLNEFRMAVHTHPEKLNAVLASLTKESPELLSAIMENQREFVAILQEPPAPVPKRQRSSVSRASALRPPSAPSAVAPQASLSAQDEDALNRLTGLGFGRLEAQQAYIDGDRNEEVAANMLCSQHWG